MRNARLWILSLFVTVFFTFILLLSDPSCARAQLSGFGGVGGESPQSTNSRTPFRIKLNGVLNNTRETERRVLKLGINTFSKTYEFDLDKAEAVDDPQVGEFAILQQVGKYAVDFDLIGTRDLLSKVGQATPGTPLRIVGFYTQRTRKLQLESVEVIGLKPQ